LQPATAARAAHRCQQLLLAETEMQTLAVAPDSGKHFHQEAVSHRNPDKHYFILFYFLTIKHNFYFPQTL